MENRICSSVERMKAELVEFYNLRRTRGIIPTEITDFSLPAPRTRRRKSFDNTSFYLNTETKKGIVNRKVVGERPLLGRIE